MNSSFRNERDLGLNWYWTPTEVQDTFDYINDNGLKGSGNYGVFGIAVCNGQGGSLREQNDNLHTVARLTYPMWISSQQILEISMQGYTGRYTVGGSAISPLGVGNATVPMGTADTGGRDGLTDERLGWTVVYYPQPFGFQCEWNLGRGPALNATQTAIEVQDLTGGYAMLMYRCQTQHCGELWPFARWSHYEGGWKSERNAPYSLIDEYEIGLEWQFTKYLELTSMLTMTDRTNTQALSAANTRSYQQFEGSLMRFQLQFTY